MNVYKRRLEQSEARLNELTTERGKVEAKSAWLVRWVQQVNRFFRIGVSRVHRLCRWPRHLTVLKIISQIRFRNPILLAVYYCMIINKID
jgi:hypothetical protein